MLLPDYKPIDLEGLLTLFTFSKKADLQRYSKSLVIHQSDFVALIMSCQSGVLPFRYRPYFSERLPSHLAISQEDRRALETNGLGRLKPRAQKTMRKVSQLFKERRSLAGHMFYTAGLHEWHFFCLDQNDLLEESGNHWVNGAHIHFVNWLWPNLNPREMWSNFVRSGKKPGSSLHLRHAAGP